MRGRPARRNGRAEQPIGTRFGFLMAPRSTVLQPGPVHGGVTTDPADELERLLGRLVRRALTASTNDGSAQTGTSSTAPTA